MKQNCFLKLFIFFLAICSSWQIDAQTYTFTPAGASGRTGPTQAQVDAAYSATSLDGQVTINTQGIQEWIVPAGVTSVTISSTGAAGGMGAIAEGVIGKGAKMQGDFTVTPGESLMVMVGIQGDNLQYVGGGGGGSFVWNKGSNQLLIAGGGAGGSGGRGVYASGIDANISNNGTNGNGTTIGGGIDGNGGTRPDADHNSTKGSTGGAGWNTGGVDAPRRCPDWFQSYGGQTPLSGGFGGWGGRPAANGGFGGGGGANEDCYNFGGGGGGGYSGGGPGVGDPLVGGTGGGGGGSYNSGTNQVNATGLSMGNGEVVITIITCNAPDSPNLSLSQNTICPGSTTTINISGNLNDATEWLIYSASCGGTEVGRTSGNTFEVTPPNGDTTYYVRGEDGTGCVDETIGVCGSITVTVEDNIAPVAIAKDITVELDANGQASITPDQINNGSTDNCTGATDLVLSLDKTQFSCADVGSVNSALALDGGDDYISITNPYTQFSNEITVSWWVNFKGNSAWMTQSTENVDNMNTNVWLMHASGANGINWYVNDGGSWKNISGNTNSGWHLVTGTADALATKLFIDGVLVNSTSGLSSTIRNNTNSVIQIGKDGRFPINSNRSSSFDVDEVLVFDRSLTQVEIENLKTNTPDLNDPNLKGYWDLNENSGEVINDKSNTAAQGVLTNMDASTDWIASGTKVNSDNTVNLTVTDAAGNSSTASATVIVEDKTAPTITCIANDTRNTNQGECVYTVNGTEFDATFTDNCSNGTITNNLNGATTIAGEILQAGETTVIWTVDDGNGQSATCTTVISIVDGEAPTAIAQDITVELDANGQASITAAQINNGSTDNCTSIEDLVFSLDRSTFDCSDVSSIIDDSQTVVTNITAWQKSTVSQDGGAIGSDWGGILGSIPANSSYTLTPSLTTNPAQKVSPAAESLYSEGGVRFYRSSFNLKSVSSQVSLEAVVSADNAVQVFINGISVALEGTWSGINFNPPYLGFKINQDGSTVNGFGNPNPMDYVIPNMPNNWFNAGLNEIVLAVRNPSGSNDIGGISASFEIVESTSGASTILTVTDTAGNSSTATANVIVEDNIAPVIVCQNITVQLDDNGMVAIDPEDVIAPLTGNYKIDQTGTFAPINIAATGTNVTIVDDGTSNQLPIGFSFNYYGIDYTNFFIGANGYVTFNNEVTPYFGGNTMPNGTIPNNLIAMAWTDLNPVTGGVIRYETIGISPNRILVVDFNAVNHYLDSDPVTVQAQLYEGSNVIEIHTTTKPFNESLASRTCTQGVENANGSLAQTVPGRNNSNWTVTNDFVSFIPDGLPHTTDNCGIANTTIDVSTFDCSNIGANTVTVTVTDINGNTATCTAIVTVKDNIDPTAIAQEVTIYLDENGNASTTAEAVNNGSFDNCEISSLSLSKTNFDCSNIGDNAVTLTVTDVNDNVSTAEANVKVVDDTNPTAIAQEVTIYLDENGNATTTAEAVNNGSFDNCEIASLGLSKTDFDCSNVGDNTVTLTVTDVNDNVSTTEANVKVVDDTNPTAIAQEVTIYLDGNGNASTTAEAMNNGSFDNCEIASLSLSKTDFDCSNVGDNTVTLTVTDVNDNVSTAEANVKVVDDTNPTTIAQEVTIYLDENGNASTTAEAVNDGSFDNCEIASLSLSKTDFDCSNVGDNTVTLTVTDVNDNVSSTEANVKVVDDTNPTAIAQEVTIYLDGNGNASTTAEAVNNGSFDNCEIASLSLSKTDFDCSNIGDNAVTLTVTDVNDNVSTAEANVKVVDDTNPTAIAQEVTIYLDENGNATTTAEAVNDGSFDNCEIASLSLSKTDFDCSNVGDNTVTLTVTDVNDNVSTTEANVKVVDDTNPTAIAQEVTIYLDGNGNASTTAEAVNNGSFDNCEIASLSLSKTDFDCSDVGDNQVTLTVIDVNGNESTTTSTVTVEDSIKPIPSAEVLPEITAECEVLELDVTAPTATDNCVGAVSVSHDASFPITTQGLTVITWSFEDVNGNIATQTQDVMLEDLTAPVPDVDSLEDLIVECEVASIAAPTATDNCAGIITGTTLDPTSYSEEGEYMILWEFHDVNGNVSTQEQWVTVKDQTAPEVSAQDLTVTVTQDEPAVITPEEVNDDSTDNCGDIVFTLDRDTFDKPGVYQVVLTATDASGNTSQATAKITVKREGADPKDAHVVPTMLTRTSIAKVILPFNDRISEVHVMETETNNYKVFNGNKKNTMQIDIAPMKGTLLVKIIDAEGNVYMKKLIAL